MKEEEVEEEVEDEVEEEDVEDQVVVDHVQPGHLSNSLERHTL